MGFHPNAMSAAYITGIFALEWGLVFNPILQATIGNSERLKSYDLTVGLSTVSEKYLKLETKKTQLVSYDFLHLYH